MMLDYEKFIMNHFMRLAMFNDYSKIKLLAVAETRFASWIIMLKSLKSSKETSKIWSLVIDGTYIWMMMWDKHNLLKRKF